MKFNDMRVSHKLWGTILGLLLAMLSVTVWMQIRSRQMSGEESQYLARYEQSITSATQWRGLVAKVMDLNTDSITTTDEALRQDFAARATDLLARITALQEVAKKAATLRKTMPRWLPSPLHRTVFAGRPTSSTRSRKPAMPLPARLL